MASERGAPVPTGARDEVAGAWVVTWDNDTRNALTLTREGQAVRGEYTNDAGERCPTSGTFTGATLHLRLRVQCERWEIRMNGARTADGFDGSYVAYGRIRGSFRMRR